MENCEIIPIRPPGARFNYGDYLLLPECRRHEIIDGVLSPVPSPGTAHQRISLKLSAALLKHVQERNLGSVLEAPCDVVLSYENVLQPDILFVRKERAGIIREMNVLGVPDLVVEILSNGSRGKDVRVKRRAYAGFCVPEYWIVDPEAASIEILVWSELGYISAGVWTSPQRLVSPLLPEVKRCLAGIFKD